MDEAEFDALLDKSLKPRGPEILYAKMRSLGLQKYHTVLDIGCRDAQHSIKLAKQFGANLVAIDPIDFNIKKATKLLKQHKLQSRVTLLQGRMEDLPLDDYSIDFVWCRDMLNHVSNLKLGFQECARVLEQNGKMLIFVNLATDLLEPKEAQFLCESLSLIPANMSKKNLERAMQSAKLKILECDRVDSEWREWGFEQNGKEAHTSQQLLRLARMRRNRDNLIKTIGIKAYNSELADCLWGVYIMLGKLCPYVYTLLKKKS